MRRVSFKLEGLVGNSQDSDSIQFGSGPDQDNGSAWDATTGSGVDGEGSSLQLGGGVAKEPADQENASQLSTESDSQKNVDRFNNSDAEFEVSGASIDVRQLVGKQQQPAIFTESQLIYLIVGSLALIGGGIALLVRFNKKKNPKIYRRRAGRLDKSREVRGAFKPAQRFKRDHSQSEEFSEQSHSQHHEEANVDELAKAGVSSLMPASTDALMLEPVLDSDGEFDFTEDLDEASRKDLETEELVDAGSGSLERSDDIVSISARPPESLQDCELSFSPPDSLQLSSFVESSPAQFETTEFEYSAYAVRGNSKSEPSSQGQVVDHEDDSNRHLPGVLTAEKDTDEATPSDPPSELDPELEQEANEFARNFFSDESNDHPVSAINEDEEVAMNLKNDDSELEFDFDLDDSGELKDSDADFNFDLDVEDVAEKSLTEAVAGAGLGVAGDAAKVVDDEIEFDFDDEPASGSGADDSAEFEAMFDDSSDDLGLELNSSEAASEVVADEVTDIEVTAEESDEIEFGFEDDDAPAIQADLGSKIGDAVGDLGDSVSEKAEALVEGAAESVGGLTDGAKAAAVAAGAAGTAAGGGFLAKVFGWGKKKKVAQQSEVDVELDEEISLDDSSDEILAAQSDEAAEVIASADIEIEEEVEFDLGDSASGEFDFSIDDDESPKALVQGLDSEIDLVDDDIVSVKEEVSQVAGVADAADSSVDLLGDLGSDDDLDLGIDLELEDDLDIDDIDLDEGPDVDALDLVSDKAEAVEAGFSSRDTLREPVEKTVFSSAETLREPAEAIASEPESGGDGLGVAAVGGAALAGAAALVGLKKSGQDDAGDLGSAALDSPDETLVAKVKELEQANSSLKESAESLEKELAAKKQELADKAAELEGAGKAEQEELVAKVETLEESNKALNESTQLLEEKLEAQVAQTEEAVAKVEKEYETKLEENVASQSEMAAELETLKAELAEAKSADSEAVSEAIAEKDAELEKMRANLESAKSSDESLKQEIESLKQQLADAESVAEEEHDGMPTSSLMGAAGLGGAAGLMGGKSLMDKSAEPSDGGSDDADLKKRFEKKLKAERRARKDAEAHLEQAEQQRNDVAKTLRGLKKELAESQKGASAKDDSLQLKALESQLERQSEKLKEIGAENEKLGNELKSAKDSVASLKSENSKLKKKMK